jgi:hypothetical protein
MHRTAGVVLAVVACAGLALAQGQQRPLSPPGRAEAHVGGKWTKNSQGEDTYQGGKWLEIVYNRPILRGRANIWGEGADYGKTVNGGAPVWRAGANQSTRLKTEVPLSIGGKTVPPGEYSVFIDLKNDKDWTLILSSWPYQQKYDPKNKAALWGAYDYTPDKDVARVPMKVETIPVSVEELTWNFSDMTPDGGNVMLVWGNKMARAPFKVASSS